MKPTKNLYMSCMDNRRKGNNMICNCRNNDKRYTVNNSGTCTDITDIGQHGP